MKRTKKQMTETPDEPKHNIIITLLAVGVAFAKCSQQKFIHNKRCGSFTLHKAVCTVYCVLLYCAKGCKTNTQFTIWEIIFIMRDAHSIYLNENSTSRSHRN